MIPRTPPNFNALHVSPFELGMPTFPPVGAVHKKCDVEGKGPCSCRNSVMQGVIIIIAPPIKTILPFFISKVSCGFWRGWGGGTELLYPHSHPASPDTSTAQLIPSV